MCKFTFYAEMPAGVKRTSRGLVLQGASKCMLCIQYREICTGSSATTTLTVDTVIEPKPGLYEATKSSQREISSKSCVLFCFFVAECIRNSRLVSSEYIRIHKSVICMRIVYAIKMSTELYAQLKLKLKTT